MKIIYVDVDFFRAHHTGAYGYGRNITANWDEMANSGLVVGRYYCSDSPCLSSRTVLSSGQRGIINGVIGRFGDNARLRLDAGRMGNFRERAQLTPVMKDEAARMMTDPAAKHGSLSDPMHGVPQVEPTPYNRPSDYMEHIPNTGRGHLAEHLSEQLSPSNGATQVSVYEADREPMCKRFIASIMAQE